MRKIREIARLHFSLSMSGRAIARACNISPATAQDYLGRLKVAGLSWPLPAEFDSDAALEGVLFRDTAPGARSRPLPDFAVVCTELRRKHVTKALLWQEYREQHPDGVGYSQFCEHYARWLRGVSVVLRQEHRAGEKMFVDFSGDGIDLVSATTGEILSAKLFVAVLGASNLTYVEAVLHEDLGTWVRCHVRALAYFGGVTEIVVPDNLKAGVSSVHRYEPEINRTYSDLAEHYGFAVIPARPRKPRDKAKVEQGVLLAERWIIAALRNHRFSNLFDINDAIAPLLEKLNERPMRKLGRSRRQVFEEVERASLRPLPENPYVLATFAKATVNIDYHVEFEKHYYSVPHGLRAQTDHQIEIRATATTVEVLHRGQRVASHLRSPVAHGFTTVSEHMPRAHQAHLEWTPTRMISWASTVGPSAAQLVEEILKRRAHPEQGYRSCLGLIRLAKKYEQARVEAACARALRVGTYSQRSVHAILSSGLDREPEPRAVETRPLPEHPNVRGSDYYN
jgi:transposase